MSATLEAPPAEERRLMTAEEFDVLPEDAETERWIIDGRLYERPVTRRGYLPRGGGLRLMNATRLAVFALLGWLAAATIGETWAADTVTFEVHAVADHPGPHTRSYLGIESGADGKIESALLVEPALLNSASVQFASLSYDPDNKPVILLSLTSAGSKKFEVITRERVGQQLGLVLGGQLYALPRIVETIHGGKIAISGAFTAREAGNLVERINASLPGKDVAR